MWKKKCEGENVSIQESKDREFEDFIEQDFITKVNVDSDVGIVARRLLRKFPTIRKPQDAIHVATCILNNVDELHTFDDNDLTKLDGKIPRIDSKMLAINPPPELPPGENTDLFVD